ncbi:MAG: RNA-binding protein [Methanosarcinaceae archaeon]|nr:RNA-binding protein [Methanosarcinaceae archaeon]
MIHHITFRVLAHATEDTSRVREALDFFLSGSGVRNSVELIEELCVEGHHGNPITIYSALLKNKAACLAFARFVKAGMSDEDVLRLRKEMPERLDEDLVFHLRFDKQAAYLGKVKLTESSDAVTAKVKIATYPKNREKAGLIVEELFG